MRIQNWAYSMVIGILLTPTLQGETGATTEAVFPFFIETKTTKEDGLLELWETALTIFNPHGSETEVVVTIFDSNGRKKRTKTLRILGFQFAGLQRDTLIEKSVTGWIMIQASQPILANEQIEHVPE